MGNKSTKASKYTSKGDEEELPSGLCLLTYLLGLLYVIMICKTLCCMQDALGSSGSKGKDDKKTPAGEKRDENYEKDALRLLDKSVKRTLKKVYIYIHYMIPAVDLTKLV